MKISEIMEELQKIKEGHGDIQVRLNCDHGQELMDSTHISLSSIKNYAYMPEYGDEGEFEITVVEIQAH